MKKYNIIYADPPWKYKVWSDRGNARSAAANHYKVEEIDNIKQLYILPILADNCALFMWAIFPCLKEAIELFARSRKGMFSNYEYEGWDVWGNEVENSIELPK